VAIFTAHCRKERQLLLRHLRNILGFSLPDKLVFVNGSDLLNYPF